MDEASNQAVVPATNPTPVPSSIDDQPVGGSKYTFSQYPDDNDTSAKKPPVRKSKLKKQDKSENASSAVKPDDIPIKATQPLDQIPIGGNKMGFDDKPIPKSNFNWSQFSEGEEAPAQETHYTMAQLLKSKANKLKLQGLQQLLQKLTDDPNNQELNEVSITPFLKETTPANLQKSLQCFKVWMEKGKSWGDDDVRNVIESGYINGKPNTKKLALQLVDTVYDENASMIEVLILTGFKSKPAKNIAGYNAVLNELMKIYGVKRLKYLKPYLPEVVRVLGAEKLPAVKNQGMNTLKEAYKWMSKEVIQPMLKDLKENLKKQLDTFWDGYDKTTVMTAPKDIAEETGKGKGKKMDAYQLSEAVDIFKKYNDKWADSVINAPKWSEKTRLMEEFVKDASVPKLAHTDFRPITEVIRRLINDSNMNVVLWVLRIIAAMAKGLRRPFYATAKNNFSNIISKFRDKKTQMVEETYKTLHELRHSLNIEDVIQDVKEGLGDKAPNMRVNMINWIGKDIDAKIQQKGQCPDKTKDALQKLFPFFEKLMGEGVAEVRQAMARNLAKMELLIDEQFFMPVKGKLNRTLIDKVESKGKKIQKELGKTIKSASKNENKSMAKIEEPPKERQSEKEIVKELESFDSPSYEQSLKTLIELGFPEQQVPKITSLSAADRMSIIAFFRENPYQNLNEMLRIIRKAYKDWKQVNLNMVKQLIAYLSERQQDIQKPQFYVIAPFVAQKIGDNKFQETLYTFVTSLCRRVPSSFIIGHLIKYVRSTQGKKPKMNSDLCSLVVKIIQLVSVNNCDVKDVTSFAQESYTVQFSKKGATQLLHCLYSFLGNSFKPLLNQETMKGMDADFKNLKLLTPEQKKPQIEFEDAAAIENMANTPQPSVSQKTVGSPPSKKSNGGKQQINKKQAPVDVPTLLVKLNDNSNWENRKNAAEALTSIIEQGGKIPAGSMSELLSTLKARVNDPNKQLIKVFVHLTGMVLGILSERDLKQCYRQFVMAMVEGLSDKNDNNKREINATLNKIGDLIGKEALLSLLGAYLEGDKEGRLGVINLMLENEEGLARADIRDYPKGLVSCLTDKHKDIRAAAEQLFEKVCPKLGTEIFRAIAKDLRPVIAKDLNAFLDRYDRNSSGGASVNYPNKSVTPTKYDEKRGLTPNMTQMSNKKRSISRNATQKSIIEDQPMSNSFYVPKTAVEGNEIFANVKVLSAERIERQANERLYSWPLVELQQKQQKSVREDLERLVRSDLYQKLSAFDYKKVLQGFSQIIKLARDPSYQVHTRELHDLILKMVLMRLWGGQPALTNVIEVVAPILTVLENKRHVFNDFEVELVLAIVREYFVSASLMGFKISQCLQSIVKGLMGLSSGEKVLKKVLNQFRVQLTSIHRHLRKEVSIFYKEGLSKLIKNILIDYIGNEQTLQLASRVRELKQDQQFVELLYGRLHENMLIKYGFRRVDQSMSMSSVKISQQVMGNGSFASDKDIKDRSVERVSAADKMPPRNHQMSSTMMELRPSNLPNPNRKLNPPSQANTPMHSAEKKISRLSPKASNAEDRFSRSFVQIGSPPPQQELPSFSISDLDPTLYNAPHSASPLSKQLSRLSAPKDETITFFTTFFTQNSDNIHKQLQTYAQFIFASILKNVHGLFANRHSQTPEKIIGMLTLLQCCIKCRHIMQNIGDLLIFGANFALTQLVHEDQNKAKVTEELKQRNIDFKSDQFIKSVNGVMLRLLENASPAEITVVLLQLLTIHSQSRPVSTKTVSLVVKCLGRVTSNFTKDLKAESARNFIREAVHFLSGNDYEMALEQLDLSQKEQARERIKPEDSAANAIKTVLIDLGKHMHSDIWEIYEKAMMESRYPDKHVASFITSLNIRPVERRSRSQIHRENDELKKINELLSKKNTYDNGVSLLKKYLDKHPDFVVQEYFTTLNFDPKFINMVMRSLEGGGTRLTPSKREEADPDQIQDKIQKLKRKFQELQPEGQGGQENGNDSMNKSRNKEEDGREERAMEIKRRIEQMKNKMSTAVGRR